MLQQVARIGMQLSLHAFLPVAQVTARLRGDEPTPGRIMSLRGAGAELMPIKSCAATRLTAERRRGRDNMMMFV